MSIGERVARIAGNLLFTRPARKETLTGLAERLEASGRTLEARFAAASPGDANRETIRHIIGIERWGQRRLRAFRGGATPADQYDGYRPAANLDIAALRGMFTECRRDTVAVARDLAQSDVPENTRVEHNLFGPFGARDWLYYLDSHANREARKIKATA